MSLSFTLNPISTPATATAAMIITMRYGGSAPLPPAAIGIGVCGSVGVGVTDGIGAGLGVASGSGLSTATAVAPIMFR